MLLIVALLLCFFISTIDAYKKCQFKITGEGNETSLPQSLILEMHNNYRSMAMNGSIECQPQAEEINMLQWKSSLAKEALEVSKTCEFKHIRVNVAEFENGVGQNIYRSCTNKRRKPNWRKAIEHWYNENEVYTFPDKPNTSNGHYTQLIWGSSEFIGCGYCEYERDDPSTKTPYCTLYVCHYGPAGNIDGEPPYQAVSLEYACE